MMNIREKNAHRLQGFNRFVALLGAWLILLHCACAPETADVDGESSAPVDPVPVHVAEVTLTTIRPSIDLVGTLVAAPERTACVTSQIGGYVESVDVVEGSEVHKDDVIVQLDSRVAESSLAKAAALVKEKEAILARLRRGYLPQEIEMALQKERQARLNKETLHTKLKAIETLRNKNEVSELEFNKTEASSHVADAEFDEAHAKLELLEAGTPPESIAEAEAQLAIARADLAAAELDVSFCNVKSPIDGGIAELSVRKGMSVAPSDKLALVLDRSNLLLQVRVPGLYLEKARHGSRADVCFDSLPERTFDGEIDRLSAQADVSSGDMNAFVKIENGPDDLLRPGLTGHTRIWLPVVENALVIPVAAIADREGVPVVTIVRDNQAFEVSVTIGEETEVAVQITSGLSAGDMIITEGGYGLPKGCPVKPIIAPQATEQ